MSCDVVVSIDSSDDDADAELRKLAHALSTTEEPVEVSPFDGASALQLIASVSAVSFPYFRMWVNSRTAARKQFKVVIDGVELTGYNEAEADRIIQTVQKATADGDADS